MFQTLRHINIWSRYQFDNRETKAAKQIEARFSLYDETKVGLNKIFKHFTESGNFV